jgi:drug/metabolite transporter (DMT)-like permease
MTPQTDSPFKGILYVCVAFFMFTAMSMLNKLLAGIHHPVEIVFYRNLTALIPCTLFILTTGKFFYLKSKQPKMLLLRTFVGTTGLALTLASTQLLPMTTATTLFFVSTLITPILAIIFLKEKVGLHRWSAIIAGFCGVLIVAQPSIKVPLIGIIIALASGMMHSFVHIILRHLRGEKTFTVAYYFFLVGVILPLPFLPFLATLPTFNNALILIAVGITGGIGQYCLTRGLSIAPASLISPFNYTGLIWSLLFDITIFGLIPTWATLTGAAIIITANLYILYRERKKKISYGVRISP